MVCGVCSELIEGVTHSEVRATRRCDETFYVDRMTVSDTITKRHHMFVSQTAMLAQAIIPPHWTESA